MPLSVVVGNCSGSLCNSLFGLVNAVAVREALKDEGIIVPAAVVWPLTHMCGAAPSELLSGVVRSKEDNNMYLIDTEPYRENENAFWSGGQKHVFNPKASRTDYNHFSQDPNYNWTSIFKKAVELSKSEEESNLFVFSVLPLDGIPVRFLKRAIRNMVPCDNVQQQVDRYTKELEIDKDTIGMHLRGADFITLGGSWARFLHKCDHLKESAVKTAMACIEHEVSNNPSVHILFCTNEHDAEIEAQKRFKNNVVVFPKLPEEKLDKSLSGFNGGGGNNCNVNRTSNNIVAAYVDLLLLASTNFKYYDAMSSFALMASFMAQDA